MKIEFDYERGSASFPSAAAERVGRASDTAVRLLILLAAHPEYREDFDAFADTVASALRCNRKELELALSFWCGAGIADLKEDRGEAALPAGFAGGDEDAGGAPGCPGARVGGPAGAAGPPEAAAPAAPLATAAAVATGGPEERGAPPAAARTDGRRSAKLMREAGLPEYSSEELADMLEKNSGALSFVDEAQRRIGRMLGPREVSILIGLRGYLELEDDYIYILLDYCSRIEKTSVRYVEKLAFGMYDEGVTDADALAERLAEREAYGQLEGRFKAMVGARGRRLTTRETRFLNRWGLEMKYDFAMIEAAYEITVDTKHEYNAAYMNGILERWYAAGIFTPEQLAAEREKKKPVSDFGNSFDTNEFFEAALRRSLSETEE